jgi:hypothetical protein
MIVIQRAWERWGPARGSPIGLAGGVVFCTETGADDKVSVVKYRIMR